MTSTFLTTGAPGSGGSSHARRYADIPALVCPICGHSRFPYLTRDPGRYLYSPHPWCDPSETTLIDS